MLTRAVLLQPLAAHLVRGMSKVPPLASAIVAIAICWSPYLAAMQLQLTDMGILVRVGLFVATVGTAFALDDPAQATTATLPVPRLLVQSLRIAIVLGFMCAIWAVVLLGCRMALEPDVRPYFPLGGFLLEGVALLTVTLLFAAARTATGATGGGAFAAPGLMLLVLAAILLPRPIAVFVAPSTPEWSDAQRIWRLLLGVAAVGLVVVCHEMRPRYRFRRSAAYASHSMTAPEEIP